MIFVQVYIMPVSDRVIKPRFNMIIIQMKDFKHPLGDQIYGMYYILSRSIIKQIQHNRIKIIIVISYIV